MITLPTVEKYGNLNVTLYNFTAFIQYKSCRNPYLQKIHITSVKPFSRVCMPPAVCTCLESGTQHVNKCVDDGAIQRCAKRSSAAVTNSMQ